MCIVYTSGFTIAFSNLNLNAFCLFEFELNAM